MAGTFEVSGANTIIRFEYEASTAMLQKVVGDAAEYLFDHGKGDHGDEENPIVFADLTNQDKLDLIDEYHIRQGTLNMAKTFKSNRDQTIARELAAQEEYNLS